MVSRRMWFAGLATALAAPYLAFEAKIPNLMQPGGDPSWLNASAGTAASGTQSFADDPQLLTPTVSLTEILRFDVTPEWVVARWPRVATVVGELEWSGMRVPLITGEGAQDIVGSLTYYFDGRQQLKRILLEGYCGDERALVTLAMQSFNLQPEASLHGGLYAARWSRQPVSVLAVQYAPMVNAESSHRRHVILELNRPEGQWRLSLQMQALLEAA
jgi:hypothetical protein